MPVISDMVLSVCCGRGSVGEVWLGTDRSGRRRAVRLVSKHQPGPVLEMERRAISLYRPVSALSSHLLRILDAGETPDCLYSVTEPADNLGGPGGRYCPDTLAARVRAGRFGCSDALRCLDQLLAGVEQLHRHSLAHGDLKPDNLVFVRRVLKIADPGLVAPSASHPAAGTAQFRPPWRADGIESDIYAIGKLIYTFFICRDPSRFPEIPPECPLDRVFGLNEIALHCCERSSRLRYHNVRQIRRDLAAVRRRHPEWER
ncbi:MAG: hypothetical protein IJS14_11910 [Lentisphaeria bacterium]|nr:hypothetical protein [Lentisphaeria bacterium]